MLTPTATAAAPQDLEGAGLVALLARGTRTGDSFPFFDLTRSSGLCGCAEPTDTIGLRRTRAKPSLAGRPRILTPPRRSHLCHTRRRKCVEFTYHREIKLTQTRHCGSMWLLPWPFPTAP